MSDDHRSESTKARARIAQAHAARPEVDHNGRPAGEATTYAYDINGRLIKTVEAIK